MADISVGIYSIRIYDSKGNEDIQVEDNSYGISLSKLIKDYFKIMERRARVYQKEQSMIIIDKIILESKPDIHLTAESKTGKISNLEFEFKAKRLFNKDYNEDGIVDEIMEIRQGINASINIVYPSKININKLTEDQIKDYKEVATNYQI